MKTIEEKAKAYADSKDTGGDYQPWHFGNEVHEMLQDAYLAGAKEVLAGQWRRGDETPDQRLCITKSKDFDNRTETRFCEWDGENFIDLYDDSVIRPYTFLPIPKDESE